MLTLNTDTHLKLRLVARGVAAHMCPVRPPQSVIESDLDLDQGRQVIRIVSRIVLVTHLRTHSRKKCIMGYDNIVNEPQEVPLNLHGV